MTDAEMVARHATHAANEATDGDPRRAVLELRIALAHAERWEHEHAMHARVVHADVRRPIGHRAPSGLGPWSRKR